MEEPWTLNLTDVPYIALYSFCLMFVLGFAWRLVQLPWLAICRVVIAPFLLVLSLSLFFFIIFAPFLILWIIIAVPSSQRPSSALDLCMATLTQQARPIVLLRLHLWMHLRW
jgi:hypothetical protein